MLMEAVVPEYEDEITDQWIENMVVLFQIEDIEEVRQQIMDQLVWMIQVYFQMKLAQQPQQLLDNMESFIREAIAELFYITHNIVLCQDEVMSMI